MKSYCRLSAAQLLRSPQKRALFHYRFQRNKPTQIHNHQPIENLEFRIKNIHFLNISYRVLSAKTEEMTSDTDAFKHFLDLYINHRPYPGPNNILALSAATAHGFRQSIRVLAGMSLGFLVVMLLCAGIAFSLAVIDPAIIHLLSWVGLRISCGWRGKLPPVQRRMRMSDQNRLAFG